MLGHRLRRWPDIRTTLGRRSVFAESQRAVASKSPSAFRRSLSRPDAPEPAGKQAAILNKLPFTAPRLSNGSESKAARSPLRCIAGAQPSAASLFRQDFFPCRHAGIQRVILCAEWMRDSPRGSPCATTPCYSGMSHPSARGAPDWQSDSASYLHRPWRRRPGGGPTLYGVGPPPGHRLLGVPW